MSMQFRLPLFTFLLLSILLSCAGTGKSDDEPARGESAPCEGCAKGGDPKLAVVDSLVWFESAEGFSLHGLSRPLGVLPFLERKAEVKGKCKFCHSYSEDALEFDFGNKQDSMLLAFDSTLEILILHPGAQVPEKDSTVFAAEVKALLGLPFLDGQGIGSLKPWEERGTQNESMNRPVPRATRTALSTLAARYGVKSLVIPVTICVSIDPDLGSEGGYAYQVLWMVFDASKGQMVLAYHGKFQVETRGDVPPDRNWSEIAIRSLGLRLGSLPRHP